MTQQAGTLVPERPAASEKPTAPDAVAENGSTSSEASTPPCSALGKNRVGDLTPDDLVGPLGFTGTFGSDGPFSGPTPGPQAAAGYSFVHRTRGATHGDRYRVSCPGW